MPKVASDYIKQYLQPKIEQICYCKTKSLHSNNQSSFKFT